MLRPTPSRSRGSRDRLLGAGDVEAAIGTELRRPIAEYDRAGASGGGGGGGAGLGGRRAYDGVQHRAWAYAGAAPRLVLGADQTLQQTDVDRFELGRLAPEVRFVWNGLPALAHMPVVLSSFAGARLRLRDEGRRGSSAVAGAGLDRDSGPWSLTTSLAYEEGVDGPLAERGMRYGFGVGLEITKSLGTAVEAWGVLVWTEPDLFQQDHHLGPSLRLALGERAWAAGSFSGAVRERPARGFVDFAGFGQIGVNL